MEAPGARAAHPRAHLCASAYASVLPESPGAFLDAHPGKRTSQDGHQPCPRLPPAIPRSGAVLLGIELGLMIPGACAHVPAHHVGEHR